MGESGLRLGHGVGRTIAHNDPIGKDARVSVDGFQANDTWYDVTDVTLKLVGLVGGVRSRAAKAGEMPKTDTSTTRIAATRALSAATRAVRQKEIFLIILYLQSSHNMFNNLHAAV